MPFFRDYQRRHRTGRGTNETLHQVTITKPFYLGKYLVTQEQWRTVMGSNPSKSKGDNLPVETVSWDDCQEFLKKLNDNAKNVTFRLPTEAEWEYACRAGTTTPFHFGSELNGRQANCDGNNPYGTNNKGPYLDKTSAVGSYAPNAWGLYDMHGNVREWCSDWYGKYPKGAVSDPTGAPTGSFRVLRGGSWFSYAVYCRAAFRSEISPSLRHHTIGFRLALTANNEIAELVKKGLVNV